MPKFVDESYIRNMPLGVPSGSLPSSEQLNELIEAASEFVQNYLDRQVEPSTVTERIVGNNRYTITLGEYPVTSVISINEIGYFGTPFSYSPSQILVHNKSGILEWIDKARYFRRDRVYEITYTAGFNPVPRAIKHATALQVIEMLQPQYAGIADNNAELIPETSAQFVDLLEPYRRKRLA